MWIDGKEKVFDESSRFGINNDHISKLIVYSKNRKICYEYDRGWFEEPLDDEVKEVVLKILDKYK